MRAFVRVQAPPPPPQDVLASRRFKATCSLGLRHDLRPFRGRNQDEGAEKRGGMSLIMGRFNNRWEEEIPSRTRSGTIPALLLVEEEEAYCAVLIFTIETNQTLSSIPGRR